LTPDSKEERRSARAQYKQSHPEAGVYRLVNTRTGRTLLGSTPNLAGLHNRLAWAKSTSTPSALDRRLQADAREYGIDVFELEVLDVLQPEPETTDAQIRDELATLEALWRERSDAAQLY
jgi:hypothetical protein